MTQPNRWPWPASRLDRDLMHGLHLISLSTHPRIPITTLVRAAVEERVARHRAVILAFPGNNHPDPPKEVA